MKEAKEIVAHYRKLLRLEETAQIEKYQKGTNTNLRKEGLLIDQFKILKKRFGFGDYPVLRIAYNQQQSIAQFKEGIPVQFSNTDEKESINGRILYMQNGEGEVVLFCDDFEEWMEGKNCLIKILPDNKSFTQMHGALKSIEDGADLSLNNFLQQLFNNSNDLQTGRLMQIDAFKNSELNDAQRMAINQIFEGKGISIIHGPPGTGKTTTLTEVVRQMVTQGKNVMVTAPANAAVDHFADELLKIHVPFVRMGNVHKAKKGLWDFTIEGILNRPENAKKLKSLKIKAEEYRRMASQYKRNFGKEERTQRKLLNQEFRSLKKEIRKETDYLLSKELGKVNVIIGTPVAMQHDLLREIDFDAVIIDEAGQCLLPMALLVAKKSSKIILAGDPFQLPPTVISNEAAELGFNKSVLEIAYEQKNSSILLNIQYRMAPKIAEFPSDYFYQGKLKSHKENVEHDSLVFIDSAGANYIESQDENKSKYNRQELVFLRQYLANNFDHKNDITFISPYSAQVALAKEVLPENIHCSTIDSFQGQEADVVCISLVRSNESSDIGFLKEYRRMNVAMTRAKEKLVIIGDSSTIGNDSFYHNFISFVEENNFYRSVFEFGYED
jgi:predicted DNA helicase